MAFDVAEVSRQYLATIVIGGSTLRNQNTGTIRAVRLALARIDLKSLRRVSSERAFLRWLDERTAEVLSGIGGTNPPWGVARKAVNLFLRACLCDHHVRTAYGLAPVEAWAEMPLDSVSAQALKRLAGRGGLPTWPGLRHLRRDVSDRFQSFAADHARAIGAPSRIYVDYKLWLENRE